MTARAEGGGISPKAVTAEFRTRLAASLEMLCGEQVDVAEASPPPDVALEWRRHPLETQTPSALYTAAPEIIGRAIGARVLSAAGLDDFTDEDVAGSYTEVLQSALSAVAQFLSRSLGSDIALLETVAIDPTSSGGSEIPAAFEVAYELQFADQTLAPLCFGLSASLLELLALRHSEADVAEIPNPPAGSASPGALPPPGAPSQGAGSSSPALPSMRTSPTDPVALGEDLSRVLDLELPIRVSFGKANVALKDVLKLSTGSIVELDRSIHDPVEIIVNDRVVGRGEVVVTEGNYGVRIQEIVSLGPA